MPVLPLSITNPSNFRDLAENVRSVPLRPQLLFRSDHLGALDANDARQIQGLGIRRVLDFRGVHERTSAACCGARRRRCTRWPSSRPSCRCWPDSPRPATASARRTSCATCRTPTAAWCAAVRPRFAEFFDLLLASPEPTVFHCTAGKDRTGVAAALLLHALGATREEILRDYLLTNERLKPPTFVWKGLEPQVGAGPVARAAGIPAGRLRCGRCRLGRARSVPGARARRRARRSAGGCGSSTPGLTRAARGRARHASAAASYFIGTPPPTRRRRAAVPPSHARSRQPSRHGEGRSHGSSQSRRADTRRHPPATHREGGPWASCFRR